MSGTFGQLFPPPPTFTERDLGDLSKKVCIITGATSGVGFEHAKMLYGKGAKVYIASRSTQKITKAIKSIQDHFAKSNGKLVSLKLDLADLSSIKASAEEFLAKEERLDVLVHNAGVMTPPAGSKTKLGHDLEMGTNCLGPFLFNKYLEPLLKRTAAASDPNSVRIVWLTSLVNVGTAPGGIVFDDKTGGPSILKNAMENYMQSKAGNIFLASVAASRLSGDGVVSVSVNPGLMKTELQRNGPAVQGLIMRALFKGPQYGAYSELFAAFSPKVKVKNGSQFVIPWGQIGALPDHIVRVMEPKSGASAAQKFWDWCEKETLPFA